MKRAHDTNLNTKQYWDKVYKDRQKYLTEQTGETARFTQTLEYVWPGSKVIDMGCGIGEFTKLVKDTYPECEVWGTDISPKVIRDNIRERNDIVYRAYRIGKQNILPKTYFDLVFCGETIEHLDEPGELFMDAYDVLRPSGRLIITTPLANAIESPEHTWYFDYDDIKKLYTDNGFKDVEFVYLPNMEHLMIIYAVGRKEGSER